MVLGWIVLTSLAASLSILCAHKLVKRALPSRECLDFQRFGSSANWRIEQSEALSGPVGEFVRRLSVEITEADRIDLVCQRIAEIDEQTTLVPERLGMLARCMLAFGGTIAVVMASRAIGQHDAVAACVAMVPLMLGGMAAFRCWWLGRTSREPIAQRRRNWDTLSRVLLRQATVALPRTAPSGQPGAPGASEEPSAGRLSHTVGRWRRSVRDSRNYGRMRQELAVDGGDPSYARLCLAWGRCFHRG